jgi:hypothetical protein
MGRLTGTECYPPSWIIVRTLQDSITLFLNGPFRKATRTLENLGGGDVVLDAAELKELSEIISKHGVSGDRGMGLTDEQQHYWG